jgi:hypothetical protein
MKKQTEPADPRPMSIGCPECGSEHLNWRLNRSDATRSSGPRAFEWNCRTCGAIWAEAVAPVIDLDVSEEEGSGSLPEQ